MGPAVGAGLRLHITNFLAIRGNFNYAVINGADSLANSIGRKDRNLSFRTPIYEGTLLMEFSLFNWAHVLGEKVNSVGKGNSNLYVFGGMSFFKFNPQGNYQGRWYDLQPLGTEGQGVKPGAAKYSLTSSALVVGLGYRVLLGGRWSLGMEAGMRKTNTDYLDDVSKSYYDNSQIIAAHGQVAGALANRAVDKEGNAVVMASGAQRGSPKYNDYFGFAQITLAVTLGSDGNGAGYGRKGKYRTRNRCFQF
ncbi:MAG: hypothetical protein GC180_06310 [Bacteroidetes bacterium]|nr:hypothetical protein [Bacteroidota bacterium]